VFTKPVLSPTRAIAVASPALPPPPNVAGPTVSPIPPPAPPVFLKGMTLPRRTVPLIGKFVKQVPSDSVASPPGGNASTRSRTSNPVVDVNNLCKADPLGSIARPSSASTGSTVSQGSVRSAQASRDTSLRTMPVSTSLDRPLLLRPCRPLRLPPSEPLLPLDHLLPTP
jgi:hypothetical protein